MVDCFRKVRKMRTVEQEQQKIEEELLQRMREELTTVQTRIGRRFRRAEVRKRAGHFLEGLLAPLQRKNGWQMAEELGEAGPRGVQRLLGDADWDEEAVRDDLRAYVTEHLGEADGILVMEETGFLKKGKKSAGVARQSSGTAGRRENSQVGVFLLYASAKGYAFIDRALSLPEEWTLDRVRCREAGIPEEVGFATKGELAQQMLSRAFASEVPAAWVVGDTVYGYDELRRFLEQQEKNYVLAVPETHAVWVEEEPTHLLKTRWVLIRRRLSNPSERAYYRVYGPAQSSLAELVRVAGSRWRIEEGYEQAKGEVGLAQYEVRGFRAWYRHRTLALLAHAILVVLRGQANAQKKKVVQGKNGSH